MIRSTSRAIATVALLVTLTSAAYADDGCDGFKWDVARERAVFAGNAEPLTAGRDAGSGGELRPERLYDIWLTPQSQVDLSVPPGIKARVGNVFAGFAHVRIADAGRYRISLDQAAWIDVVGAQGVIASSDFAGQRGCSAPHKVVQFELPAGSVLLQVTGAAGVHLQVAVTRVPSAP